MGRALTAGWFGGALSGCRNAGGISSLPADLAGGWVGAQVARAHAWRDGELPRRPQVDPIRVHTLVVGAGVAGLSAARRLLDAGLDDLVVLDLEDQPGGNARSHVMSGLLCPLGAHYLPMPGSEATAVAQWLERIGVIRSEHGHWVADERYLCHSAQERLFVPDQGLSSETERGFFRQGQWQDGLLPQLGLQPTDLAQYRRFSVHVSQLQHDLGFSMPTWKRAWNQGLNGLDQVTFADWLKQHGYDSPALLWMLDYACRDDYGAGVGRVSAWAGVHYFASRHGFEWPAQAEGHDAVLTWPQGNGWLTQRLAEGLDARWQKGCVAVRVEEGRNDVSVLTWSPSNHRWQTWSAKQVILAVPLFVAKKLLTQSVSPLNALVPKMAYAPWLVSNVLLKKPFMDRPGVPLAWDNVVMANAGSGRMTERSLGYVDARHQSLSPVTGPMLLTHYWALGGQTAQQGQAYRKALLSQPWQAWATAVLTDLAQVHPDLPGLVERVDLMRYGHAMSIPVPGVRSHAALPALLDLRGRVRFAHSDLSAYSVFEEAFTHGVRAADQLLHSLGMVRSMA